MLAQPERFGTTLFSSHASTIDWPELPFQIAEYELTDLLGRGANGSVYRARHAKLDRFVAIKLMPRSAAGRSSETDSAFLSEMRTIGRLDHPNIVRATDAGETEQWYYLVMEYEPGIDVSTLVRRHGQLPVSIALQIALQTAKALQYIDQHELVHCDVKPSNLLLTDAGETKLLDLGLAGLRSSTTAEHDPVLIRGTADYMAPEQWKDLAQADIRSDLYSLGCTLQKLLTGKAPFQHLESVHAKQTAHCTAAPSSVVDVRPELPAGLQAVLDKLLAKQPQERHQSAQELIAELRPLVAATTPRKPIIRRHFLAAGILAMLAGLWKVWPKPSQVGGLNSTIWRSLHPRHPQRLIAHGQSKWQPDKSRLDMTGEGCCLINLGQPVSGQFAIAASVRLSERAKGGLFFAYNSRELEDRIQHSFQFIELEENGNGVVQVLWARHDIATDSEMLGPLPQPTLLAGIEIEDTPKDQSYELRVELGRDGFPNVHFQNQLLDKFDWDLTHEGRKQSSVPGRLIKNEFRGKVGVIARFGDISVSNPRLRYLS